MDVGEGVDEEVRLDLESMKARFDCGGPGANRGGKELDEVVVHEVGVPSKEIFSRL